MNRPIEKIHCSGCLKPLCEISFISGPQKLLLDEQKPAKYTISIDYIKCLCPFCGDTSMPVEVTSRYIIGPATKLADPDDENSFLQLTRYIGSERKGKTLIIKVTKWDENEKK